MNTVENKVFDALKQLGLCQEIGELRLQRCSRTDKTVSACMNNISFICPKCDNFVEKVNQLLPDDIRCYGIMRVTPSFKPREYCTGRAYIYWIPLELLVTKRVEENKLKMKNLMNQIYTELKDDILLVQRQFNVLQYQEKLNQFWDNNNYQEVLQSQEKQQQLIDIIQPIADLFYTTYSNYFWNFTSQNEKLARSGTIRRYDLFKLQLVNQENKIFIKCDIQGNAFLYNQIRKMIAALINISNLDIPMLIVSRALTAKTEYKTEIMLAPGEYLCLKSQQYGQYKITQDFKNYGQILNERPEIIQQAEQMMLRIQKVICQTPQEIVDEYNVKCENYIKNHNYYEEAINTLKDEINLCKLINEAKVTVTVTEKTK